MRSRTNTRRWSKNPTPTPKTATNTSPPMCSGCRALPAGPSARPRRAGCANRKTAPPHVDSGNANYEHFVHHLSPKGVAGFVLANGAMSSNTSGEGEIRRRLIEADLVDCMLALPGQLFYTTQIPACLWFLTRSKAADNKRGYRNRQGETLFIDARNMGALIDRTHRELSADEIAEIARTYHAWRGEAKDGAYQDRPGFCKSATLDDIASHDFVLTPGRYVGAAPLEEDGVPFEEKMAELSGALYQQMRESVELDAVIRDNLERLGFGE